MEDQLAALYKALDRGDVVVVTSGGALKGVPIRTSEVKDAYVREYLVQEAQTATPDFARAEANALLAANRYLSKMRVPSRAKMTELLTEMSAFRTQRQRAEGLKLKASKGINISFSGAWSSNYGDMELTQSGNHVSGTYPHQQGKIDGNIQADGQLHFNWTQANAKGIGVFKLSADGRRLSGTWNYTGANGELGSGGSWSATRK